MIEFTLDLEETLSTLRWVGLKLNPAKCIFRVMSGKFLGHVVLDRGLKTNLKKILVFFGITSPKNIREVQALTTHLVALGWFLSRATDKQLHFFKTLIQEGKFEWTAKCEQALQSVKVYVRILPLLPIPRPNEPLYLYQVTFQKEINVVLIQNERRRKGQFTLSAGSSH